MTKVYITWWTSAGWKRIPIIPKFLSNHIDPSAPLFVFGEVVLDVLRLSQAIGIHLIQWHEVKDPESQLVDDLGCWPVWETVQQHIEIPEPRQIPSLNLLKLALGFHSSRRSHIMLRFPLLISAHHTSQLLPILYLITTHLDSIGSFNRCQLPSHNIPALQLKALHRQEVKKTLIVKVSSGGSSKIIIVPASGQDILALRTIELVRHLEGEFTHRFATGMTDRRVDSVIFDGAYINICRSLNPACFYSEANKSKMSQTVSSFQVL
ncbi:uncharacterized protein F5147DRAFT_653443 [Suillus discolor]|uniref:Uncharacterized protein n=1 Tax=Suillus discolor TaxID=1912936 RepID=A0A9P7F609_9AGAM|nr:uncharacterized protein F5147DRAFT_653443 [Suillus discolor]KAG2107218.1 hypothetical protein F5147DRAFT_653443 [Suillus discolor]